MSDTHSALVPAPALSTDAVAESTGRPVKKMIGGLTGWHDEGFAVATSA